MNLLSLSRLPRITILLVLLLYSLAGSAQELNCDHFRIRSFDSVAYYSGIEEEGQILVSIQRQCGLGKNNPFDMVLFTLTASIPISELDSLGLLKYPFSGLTIILEDNSTIQSDTESERRMNEYLKPPSSGATEFRCGGLNPPSAVTSQELASFSTVLSRAALQKLCHHKLKCIQFKNKRIVVPGSLADALIKQFNCIAAVKLYRPRPKGLN